MGSKLILPGHPNFYLAEDGILYTPGAIRSVRSVWWRDYHMSGASAAPGASGATAVQASANTVGGYSLSADAHHLIFNVHIESDWDGASDPIIECWFEYDDANEEGDGGATTDNLILLLPVYYKAPGEAANKTQALTDTVVIGRVAQYTMFKAEFIINWDLGSHVVQEEDVFGLHLSLDVSNSTVTGGLPKIIVNFLEFKYKTAKVKQEI